MTAQSRRICGWNSEAATEVRAGRQLIGARSAGSPETNGDYMRKCPRVTPEATVSKPPGPGPARTLDRIAPARSLSFRHHAPPSAGRALPPLPVEAMPHDELPGRLIDAREGVRVPALKPVSDAAVASSFRPCIRMAAHPLGQAYIGHVVSRAVCSPPVGLLYCRYPSHEGDLRWCRNAR